MRFETLRLIPSHISYLISQILQQQMGIREELEKRILVIDGAMGARFAVYLAEVLADMRRTLL